jgi:hypothetical protein
MKKALVICIVLLLVGCKKSDFSDIKPYTDYLEENEILTAKNYILKLWDNHDVVILCERFHGEMTQYDLILDVVQSDYFIENVGNIFTEVGSVSRQDEVLEFIRKDFDSKEAKKKALLDLYRNISWPSWAKSNFYFFLDSLNDLNTSLPEPDKVNLYTTDLKIPARGSIKSVDDYREFLKVHWVNRDSLMAANIVHVFDSIQESNAKRKKCLVIMNYRHAFSKPIDNQIDGHLDIKNTGQLLFNHYQNNAANVYFNSLASTFKETDTIKNRRFRDYVHVPIQNGKWDAAFELVGKEAVGFDFANTPFGKDSLDIWAWSSQYSYQDMFTGFVYYLPLSKHYQAFGIPNYLDDGFEDELYHRLVIFKQMYGGSEVKKEQLKENYKYEETNYDDLKRFNEIIDKAKGTSP